MHVLITGAAGMVGRRLAERLAREGQCAGQAIDRLTLTDVVAPSLPVELAGRATIRVERAIRGDDTRISPVGRMAPRCTEIRNEQRWRSAWFPSLRRHNPDQVVRVEVNYTRRRQYGSIGVQICDIMPKAGAPPSLPRATW